jgi:hypothetical protein
MPAILWQRSTPGSSLASPPGMRRFFLLMVLLAGCAPTRPMTADERAERWELPPPRPVPNEPAPVTVPPPPPSLAR